MSDQKQTKENETMNAAQVLVRCLENEVQLINVNRKWKKIFLKKG